MKASTKYPSRIVGDMPAVRDGHIYEIESAHILQPGPAALTDGLRQLCEILARVRPADGPRPD